MRADRLVSILMLLQSRGRVPARELAETLGVSVRTIYRDMEALDMAKKVTHDRAGRVLKRELRQFGLDFETARRLFTLLLSLRVDTTRLTGIHGHRTIR